MCDIGLFDLIFQLIQFAAINLLAVLVFLTLRRVLRGRHTHRQRG